MIVGSGLGATGTRCIGLVLKEVVKGKIQQQQPCLQLQQRSTALRTARDLLIIRQDTSTVVDSPQGTVVKQYSSDQPRVTI